MLFIQNYPYTIVTAIFCKSATSLCCKHKLEHLYIKNIFGNTFIYIYNYLLYFMRIMIIFKHKYVNNVILC